MLLAERSLKGTRRESEDEQRAPAQLASQFIPALLLLPLGQGVHQVLCIYTPFLHFPLFKQICGFNFNWTPQESYPYLVEVTWNLINNTTATTTIPISTLGWQSCAANENEIITLLARVFFWAARNRDSQSRPNQNCVKAINISPACIGYSIKRNCVFAEIP